MKEEQFEDLLEVLKSNNTQLNEVIKKLDKILDTVTNIDSDNYLIRELSENVDKIKSNTVVIGKSVKNIEQFR